MPRISANKLGEYMVCPSAPRRRRIVVDQKHPKDVIVAAYRAADEPLLDFFRSGGDVGALDKAVVRLRAVSGTPWKSQDARSTADALEAISNIANKFPFAGVSYAKGPDQANLHVGGVDISVAHTHLLLFQQRGVDCVGALKLHFPKADERTLGAKGGEYVATLLHQWLLANGPRGRRVQPSHCISVDVFRKAVVAAPSAFTRRMADVTAACEEIAALWAKV